MNRKYKQNKYHVKVYLSLMLENVHLMLENKVQIKSGITINASVSAKI